MHKTSKKISNEENEYPDPKSTRNKFNYDDSQSENNH
jgi:hypothetical protein